MLPDQKRTAQPPELRGSLTQQHNTNTEKNTLRMDPRKFLGASSGRIFAPAAVSSAVLRRLSFAPAI
jgi:hypothetical protein